VFDKFEEESEEMDFPQRVVAHNLALLDALAELTESKKKLGEELGHMIKALVIMAGGEVNMTNAFISAGESPTCELKHEIVNDGESIRLWVEEVEGGE